METVETVEAVKTEDLKKYDSLLSMTVRLMSMTIIIDSRDASASKNVAL